METLKLASLKHATYLGNWTIKKGGIAPKYSSQSTLTYLTLDSVLALTLGLWDSDCQLLLSSFFHAICRSQILLEEQTSLEM